MALEIIEFKTKKRLVFKTPKELKELLIYCNPTIFRFYREQITRYYPHIQVWGMGTGVEILRK